ncbi:S-methyl-5'-thioadenosine phosphorylase [Kibdelosporangium phytohabitans]|uniref:Purine nucleoside phosphorylase n=1 Tax=Kibdelosporangium phytohabitans TaxID=860235 RepID=A0A0N9HYY4_9PSEU|nr:S-methyl-5'-thioadenosine phosphorylase [Kibdelosporangium phytohabitans]ALG08529.1 purine nucleoside phosphorylase [Kibdelosporangium phytohabitans]MBE1470399.1 5'-methylthioadenosine phosphorylase [Kibdelosporangium phytohabitans]
MTLSQALPDSTAAIGVIGGSGFYELFDNAETVPLTTPYGSPSGAVTIGEVHGRRVAFLPRHGSGHSVPAHRINYRANLWALRQLGVRQVLAPCAVGSLDPAIGPGSILVPDQVVDRTQGRVSTFYDHGAVHVSFADPYCPVGCAAVDKAGAALGDPPRLGGTMVVIQGPRFSSRAESQWYAAAGWTVVNMTGMPEAVLARELAQCYTPIALVTDVDAGVDAGESVTQTGVFETFARNIGRLRELVFRTIDELPADQNCTCGQALDGVVPSLPLPGGPFRAG